MAKVDIPKKILLIDDDQTLTEILAMKLRQTGYTVDIANSGEKALTTAAKHNYDSIVLDLNMPGMDGFAVCQHLRHSGNTTPILVLSGVTEKLDIVQVLDTGADEYLTKPFDSGELTARLKALIRRNTRTFDTNQLSAHGAILHLQERRLQIGKKTTHLTPTETILLSRLMQHSPEPISRQALFEEVWGIDDHHTSNRLDAYIKRLRGKIESLTPEQLIHTLHAAGYYFGSTR